jgi:hypothetical protein
VRDGFAVITDDRELASFNKVCDGEIAVPGMPSPLLRAKNIIRGRHRSLRLKQAVLGVSLLWSNH